MNILGLNVFHADSSAVLLKDGELVAGVAEERLNRIKHFAGFPELAIRYCLEEGGITLADVDAIAIARDSKANIIEKAKFSIRNITNITRLAKQRLENRAAIKREIPQLMANAFNVDEASLRSKFQYVEHHMAHMASAFHVSPFEDAAILSVDGLGDFVSTMLGKGCGNRIETLDKTFFPHSLGFLYTMVCQYIGYCRYGDEGKIMGLAPYGEDAYADVFDSLVHLKPEGRFELNLDFFNHHTVGVDYSFDEKGFPTVAPLYSQKMVETFGPVREPYSEITERDKNLAASLQKLLEKTYFHILRHLANETNSTRLCLAGGVSLNSVANGMIFEYTPFREVYCQPAASDDGTALGAALYIHHVKDGQPRGSVMNHASIGPVYTNDECENALRTNQLEGTKLEDAELVPTVARDIADGKVVGWFQGRMEWGPRALGNRSIVCHPGYPNMKDILNSRIKHREWYRPFAPSVLEEETGNVFQHDYESPFMMMVYKVRPEYRERLQAINHVDDTGRLQTVSKEHNPRYHHLISEFFKITGIPVVLNTSFNENEPIVCTPEEAIDCFNRTKMDVLVLENWYIKRVDG